MAALISKRQQARNEKTLQELLHKVPGNNVCADCGARNPAWASWSLGIFLCMRCASIHRKLGTHISKVKSLTMDGWSNDQVENMKRVGNIASNKIYNPENKRPDIPIDADEADSVMERFIRAKYVQHNTTPVNGTRRHNTGSTESDEGTPPPLPPKTGMKFFKPLSFRSKKTSHHGDGARSQPEELRSKPSKIFGASVHQDSPEDTARKLTQLRDMGFVDDKRNAMVLKGVNGNLEKTVEALVRLGEGAGGGSSSLAAPRQNSLSIPRTLTPTPTTPVRPRTAGITRTSPPPSHSPATSSNNPFDMPPAPPQSSQSTGTLQNKNPFYAVNYSTNPFGMPTPQADQSLNQSLQNLSLAPPQPQLFPHHTGGLPVPAPMQQQVYQQPLTPPMPQSQNFTSIAYNNNQTYPQLAQQPQQSYNPFLQPQPTQQPLTVNTSPFAAQPAPPAYGSNPFQRSPTRIASPTLNQIPEQSQQNFYGMTQPAYGNNPFFNTSQAAPQPVPQPQPVQPFDQAFFQAQPQLQMQQQPTTQTQIGYQPQFRDKSSILALYNYPSLAPQPLQQLDQAGQTSGVAQTSVPGQVGQAAPTQSTTQAVPGTNNPFFSGAAGPAPSAPPSTSPLGGARSRESVNLGMEMAWNNGRHSPDAFASLSARSGL